MQTVTVDILNDEAMKLLHDLELLQLIRVRKDKESVITRRDLAAKYKGAMTKQPLAEVDKQLAELRDSWG